ncbi:MAG: SDR family oxidoreductase [Lachnospiraceae bacterium]|nr:SDR family oxidoreductase [Lachnospiraceae bacterium]
MDLHLNGKVVVITGGATGIGKAAAREFLPEGACVAILGRREEVLRQFHDELLSEGYDIYYESCDVTDRKAVEAYAARVRDKFGSIDVWINNAGIAIDKPFLDFTEEDWNKVTSINLKAVFDCTQIAAAYMKKQGAGVIINASSFASKIPHANGVIYAATKAAVSNMTKSTAAALAPYGIRVLGYIPGMIVTPISESMVSQYREKFTKDIALGRLGHPEDLAKPIVFMASDAAAYMTGIDIEVSGGKFAVQDCAMAYRFAEKDQG